MSSSTKPLILCVDDEPAVLRFMKRVISESGYGVLTAESGDMAILTIHQTKPDLILLDIMMPGMDGYQVCARLQEHEDTAPIPVIFATSLGSEQDKARALAMGAVAYLVKPFESEALLAKIRAQLDMLPRWKALHTEAVSWKKRFQPSDFLRFKEHLAEHLNLLPDKRERLMKTPPARIYSITAELGIRSGELAQAIAKFMRLSHVPRVNHEDIRLGVLQPSFCKTHQVVPVRDASAANAFVLSNPFNWELLDMLKKLAGQPAILLITEPENIAAVLFGGSAECEKSPSATDRNADFNLMIDVNPEGEAAVDVESDYEDLEPYKLAKEAKLPPIIRLVNTILTDAVKTGASDVHIEPQETLLQVRYRVDGLLQDVLRIPKHLQPSTISRFKVISGMDIADHRKPQDGRSRLRFSGGRVDLRVSSLPTQFGEKIVIRILDSSKGHIGMDHLGLMPDNLRVLQRLLASPQGMILVTGPTGSGKTTTLYASLNWLKSPTKNVVTLEDPIEFKIAGLNQVQINPKAGMTFAAGLRSILRQDPNVILVGEIRDQETATIALEASQTGHLLLSTLHTNDAAATITRLLDLGIEPFKVASSVIGILAQRLVRRVCDACAVERPPMQDTVEKLGGSGRLPAGVRWKAGAGCGACQETGYKGRLAIHELLEMTEMIREMIVTRAADQAIREAARQSGMRLMMEDGIAKAAQGLTTLDEVLRVVPPDAASRSADVKTVGLSGRISEGRTPPESARKASEKASILILEDDPDTQALLKLLLENGGYETTVAGDGIEALMHLGKKDFDLIMSDITMPNLDGIELLEMNNKKGIQIPVIFLTAQSGEEIEVKVLELGAADYLKKPIKKDILLMRVRKVLEKPVSRTE
jgi:type IV pilus assembly protein PilB